MRAIDYFDKAAEENPERTALIDGSLRYTYAQLRGATEALAKAMRAAGLKDEDRAAIFSVNDPRVLVCMLAIMRAGGTWVPINHRNALDANVEFMKYAEVLWLFYHSSFREQLEQIRRLVPSLGHLICIDAAGQGDPSLEEFTARGDAGEAVDWGDPLGNPDRLVGLVPTGGTTGPAKGVRVTTVPWGMFTEMVGHYWRFEGSDPVCLSTAPLSHAAGVVSFALFTLGATNVIMPRFDALQVLENIERYRVTHLFLPPTAFYALLDHPRVRKFNYSSLRVLLLAASPVSPDRVREGVEIFGPCVCQCYGQTEAPMLMSWLDQKTVAAAAAGDHPERLRSCGKATYGVRLAIMDEAGRLLPPNQTGEIVARGSLITPGYHNLPEATAEIRKFGWHHTGDVGYRDEDGFFYIVDRKKDMIITGGFNVFSAEVEAAIMSFAQVYECAVIGVPDEKWGEAVKAMIVLRAGRSLSQDAVLAHCKDKLGGVKSPKTVEFVTEIPKTPAGKTDRRTLRAPYWAGMSRAVH
ncbi:MAG TPA: AMP-binding protein [Verrucomicrobiae bacterium]|nr:AMP-binding protein [Verrucomicrobiae bacterium]